MKLIGIYQITCKDWLYIGQSVDIRTRWQKHLSKLKNGKHENPIMQRLWDKYSSVEFKLIFECEPEELTEWEQAFVDAKRLRNPQAVMNLSICVDSPMKNRICSEETREKLRLANKGKKHSEETKKKLSEAKKGNASWLGKRHSEETREKLSEAKKGNTSWLGKKHSEESKEKMRLAQKGRKHSEESKEKMRLAQGKRRNQEKKGAE